jgi:hypothetical protein
MPAQKADDRPCCFRALAPTRKIEISECQLALGPTIAYDIGGDHGASGPMTAPSRGVTEPKGDRMSKTDKTRPWWVRLADKPMVTCLPVHDHRFGLCTLPDKITAESASLGPERAAVTGAPPTTTCMSAAASTEAGSGITSDAKSAAAAVAKLDTNCAPITAKADGRGRADAGRPRPSRLRPGAGSGHQGTLTGTDQALLVTGRHHDPDSRDHRAPSPNPDAARSPSVSISDLRSTYAGHTIRVGAVEPGHVLHSETEYPSRCGVVCHRGIEHTTGALPSNDSWSGAAVLRHRPTVDTVAWLRLLGLGTLSFGATRASALFRRDHIEELGHGH